MIQTGRVTVELDPVKGKGRMLKTELGHKHNIPAFQNLEEKQPSMWM